MLRNTFVTSLARFTMLHSPASMRLKHARAFRWVGGVGGGGQGLAAVWRAAGRQWLAVLVEQLKQYLYCWLRLHLLLLLSKHPCIPTPPALTPCRALLVVAEQNGNHLCESWTEVLRCVSRFELLQQLTAGVPTDALLFAMPDKAAAGSAADKLKRRILRRKGGEEEGPVHDSFSSINDMGLHASECASQPGNDPGWGGCSSMHCRCPALRCPAAVRLAGLAAPCSSATCPPLTAPPAPSPPPAGTREVDKKHLPPADVMASVDVQELNRLFVNSGRLDSEAIVQFVKTLGAIAQEELRPVACPRVFSLTKIVEIAHFNMGRIRWGGGGGGGGG